MHGCQCCTIIRKNRGRPSANGKFGTTHNYNKTTRCDASLWEDVPRNIGEKERSMNCSAIRTPQAQKIMGCKKQTVFFGFWVPILEGIVDFDLVAATWSTWSNLVVAWHHRKSNANYRSASECIPDFQPPAWCLALFWLFVSSEIREQSKIIVLFLFIYGGLLPGEKN